ncbi:MAG TPA: AAA family ATPase, partial [Terriglobia bacterium]|nr:AAA family ATPase [Terriglobia bacterium]
MLRARSGQPVLLELRVENYAVIDHVAVEFAPGLNLLTGETGAGKSILIDALALVLGEKASSDVIRHGAEKAVVSCVFEAEPGAAAVLEDNGLDLDGDEIILRREISGKGRVFVNNQPATVAVLRQLAPRLASVHAQNESLAGFDAAARLELLDQYAGTDTAAMTQAYASWKSIRLRITDLERGEQDRLRLLDLWRFQKKEIEQAKLEPGEDERLEAAKRVLANAEKIYGAAMAAYEQLYDGNTAAAASMRSAARQLDELARYDARFLDSAAALDSARITVEDLGATLRDYAEGINAS